MQDYDPQSAEAKACISQPAGIHTLAPSPTNPRKSFPDAEMLEMTESVKQHGVLQPLLVRCWPVNYAYPGDTMPYYEIVAGERRYRAAKAAGLTLVPVLVRDLDDRAVLELQVIENLQRKDLHPIEEAEGYGLMMDKHGYTADQLAEKIGKSRSYIFGRLKLLALSPDGRRLFQGGLLNPSTALLIARIPTAKLQAKAIQEITSTDGYGDVMSVRRAARLIQDRYMLKLAGAPFKPWMDDLVPSAGSCNDCPKRTGNQPEIFDDATSANVCTDPDCFQAKRLAQTAREAAKVVAAGGQVITGKAAEKLAAYGIQNYTTIPGYTQLDKTCYDDPENRTYREILGDDLTPTMIEDVQQHVLVPVLPNTVLAEKLQAAGLRSRDADREADEAKKAVVLAQERTYRDRLLAQVRDSLADQTLNGESQMAPDLALSLMRRIARRLFERAGDNDTLRKIIGFWKPTGRNYTERRDAILAAIDSMNLADCWRLMIDLMVVGSSMCNDWSMQYEPRELIEVASLFGIDAEQVKASVIPEGTAPSATAEKHAYPSEAAQAQETNRAETPEGAPEAAPAGETSTAENETPPADAGLIETNEKPFAGWLAFVVGDQVRVRANAKGPTGKKRKCCGREGVIEGKQEACCLVRFGPGRDVVSNLAWDEIEKVETPSATETPATDIQPTDATETSLIETDEKPAHADCAERPYQHPEHPNLRWSGRGRKPKWVEAWLATPGNTLDALKPTARCDKTADLFLEAA
ncbi:ParB/RepB/Spo0J family partition protein [Azonexus caeni]|jgi:ParB/RepB/Spo0J family partition protein|uniref:ParB/RepB/Spo0J family partition protein n=1 Tax=Azonexus caeni TaxID=266126 RepID=UPI003A845B8D